MSVSVSIYADQAPTIDQVGGWIFLEDSVAIRLPIDPDAAAAWCEAFGSELGRESIRLRAVGRQTRRDLALAHRMVEEARQEANR